MLELVELPGVLLPEAGIVVVMLVLELFLLLLIIPRTGPNPTVARMVLVSSALLGSAVVLLALPWAFLYPNLNSFTILFETFGIAMGFPPGLWMIAIIAFHDRRADGSQWGWPVAITALATLGELLMGVLFTIAGSPGASSGDLIVASLTSFWYLWSMGAAMVALLLWIPRAPAQRNSLLGLAAAGFVAPWVAASPVLGALLSAIVMVGTVAVTYRGLQPLSAVRASDVRVVGAVAVGFVVMTAAGLLLAFVPENVGAALAFGLIVSAVMVGEFLYLLRDGLYRRSVPAPASPELAFGASGAAAVSRT